MLSMQLYLSGIRLERKLDVLQWQIMMDLRKTQNETDHRQLHTP